MHQNLAKNALALIDQVRGPYDDQNLNAVMQTKAMLYKIASGELVVTPRKVKAPRVEAGKVE